MHRTAELNAIIDRYNLNGHPFYQDWVKGTLPVEKLRSYASEYGHFIGTISDGWDTIGQSSVAEEERSHEVLWNDFRHSIGSGSGLSMAGTMDLMLLAKETFAEKSRAIGGLYAFEAQQPHTSALKLQGLKDHYAVPAKGLVYFEVHAEDETEPQLLLAEAEKLSPAEFEMAKSGCEAVASAMWKALDAVYAD